MGENNSDITAFEVNQAMVALEMEEPDQVLLDYLTFFFSNILVSSIFFIHALEEDGTEEISGYLPEELTTQGVDEDVVTKMEALVKKTLETTEREVNYDIREGNPLEVLMEAVESMDVDLTIIGQAKESKEHGILAKNLIRKTSSNALIIPEGTVNKIRRIMVPVDFSDNSARALKQAVSINKSLDVPAEILAFHAYELPNLSSYKAIRTQEEFEEMHEKNILEGFEAFCHTHIPADRSNVRVRLVKKEFPGAASYIMDFAEEHDIDFIVMGAKGHSKVELLLLGSVTESLMVRNEKYPVFVVK